jgi:uncharacterized membrane protein YraQ (UPF0718 family)
MDPFAPLAALSEWLTYEVIGLEEGSALGESVAFFLYDVPKILIMLAVIVFVVAIIRTYFPPERTKKMLSHTRLYIGNVLAALLGVVTPFCSCSAVPLFIGFVEAGIPLGVTFSFLIASPMVNEVALVLLWGMFGWEIALIYLVAGLTVAIVAGIVIGKLGLEDQVEEYVYQIKVGDTEAAKMVWSDRIDYAKAYVKEIVGKVWPWVVVAIAIGAVMHGYLPDDFLARVAGEGNPLAVPLAVVVGIPLYSSAAAVIPIVSVLVDKGVQMGTVLAFMMAVTALSVPELIILRRVLKPRLIGIFVGIMAVAIIAVGYLFNWIL